MKLIIACILLCVVSRANRLLQATGCSTIKCKTGLGPCFDNPHGSPICCPNDGMCAAEDYNDQTMVLCEDGNVYDNKCYGYCAGNDPDNCRPNAELIDPPRPLPPLPLPPIPNYCGGYKNCQLFYDGCNNCDCGGDGLGWPLRCEERQCHPTIISKSYCVNCINGYRLDMESGTCNTCADDTIRCKDGSYVRRDPFNNCQFKKCPIITPPIPICDNFICEPGQNCYDTSNGPFCCAPGRCEGGPPCGGLGDVACKPSYECVVNPLAPCDLAQPHCSGVCFLPRTEPPKLSCAMIDCKNNDVCYEMPAGPVCCDPNICAGNKCSDIEGTAKCAFGYDCVTNPLSLCDPLTNENCASICVNPNAKPTCGGFDHCLSYNNGCDDCICGKNGNLCTLQFCPPLMLQPRPKPKCTRCMDGYGLNKEGICVKSAICLADMKRCPDGSFVGRDHFNNCQFRECPVICGGFEHCAAYHDGCNGCTCGLNGLDACTKMGCPPLEFKPAPKCTKCKDGYELNASNECVAIPRCGGIDYCLAYKAGCRDCYCEDPMNPDPRSTVCTSSCEIIGLSITVCTKCMSGYELNPITNQCDKTVTTEDKCCALSDRPDMCWEGVACCPNGEWSCSFGDAKRYTCGGKTLVFGEDIFGEVCKVPDICTKGQCKNPAGICAPLANCFANPCEMSTCHGAATCEANYCGGCYPIWKDIKGNLMSTEQCKFKPEPEPPTPQCCPLSTWPGRCIEGIACCPNGKWSCSIGDGTTYTCGGKSLTLGEDTFGRPCTDECPGNQCMNPMDNTCKDLTVCLHDACRTQTCDIAHSCQANYCGGCNAIFKDINGNILTKQQCSVTSTLPPPIEQCCDPKMRPGFNGSPMCSDGSVCCPDGRWSCGMGNGGYSCGGKILIPGQDTFGRVCESNPLPSGCATMFCPMGSFCCDDGFGDAMCCSDPLPPRGNDKVLCKGLSDCDYKNEYVCSVDPECLGKKETFLGCSESKVCLMKNSGCKVDDMKCADGYVCVLINHQNGFCVQYENYIPNF